MGIQVSGDAGSGQHGSSAGGETWTDRAHNWIAEPNWWIGCQCERKEESSLKFVAEQLAKFICNSA